ncbi:MULTISPECIES: FHA domain-containing protein [unclassified Lysobacter]
MPVPSEVPMLHVQLLGERGLWSGRRDVSSAIHYRKGWALLGYLAVERGRRHARADLAQLLWPTLADGSARTNLRQVLADLNQALVGHGGVAMIESDRDNIGLFPQPGTTIDLVALDQIEVVVSGTAGMDIEAVERDAARFGGEFLHGLALRDCGDFESWLLRTRTTLAKRTDAVLTRLCEVQRADNRLPQAIVIARGLVSANEWNERHLRLLMELLAAAGLHAQALDAYETLRVSLAADLDSEPEAQTQALRVRIEADRRRGLMVPGPAIPAAVAEVLQPRFGDVDDSGADADADRRLASKFNTGPVTRRTLPVTAALAIPGVSWIEVVQGADQGVRLMVTEKPLVIGRSSDADLRVVHQTVSRHHCAIWREGSRVRIRDLGSTNRTRVNDARVEEAELSDGDNVMLGETVLRFVCDPG